MKCEICEKEFNHLGLHLNYSHKDITHKEYYDKYLKKEKDGFCHTCNKQLKFISITKGYQHYCNAKCELADPEITKKARITYKLRTGYDHNMLNPESKERVKNTTIEHYGAIGFGSDELANKILDTYNKEHNTNITSCNMIVHEDKILEQKRIETRIKNNNGSYMTDEHKEKLIASSSSIETIKKRVNNRFKKYGDKYMSDEAYEKLKNSPITTYSYANMLEFNNNSICVCHCNKCNRDYKIHLMTLRTRKYANQEPCTYCNPLEKQYSIAEKELYDYIKSIYNGLVIENDRMALSGKEIDIYLPELKLGFEYDGTYWHADPRFYNSTDIIDTNGKTAQEIWKKDKDKEILAESLGIYIIRIPEYDWVYDNENIKTMVKEIIDLLKKPE